MYDQTTEFDPPAGAMADASVVFINGPPYSGKDTAAAYLQPFFKRSTIVKFAGPLKHSTHIDFGLPSNLPDDFFENCKDIPNPAFFGLSPREAYIQKSEKRQKPFLGDDIYGLDAVRTLWRRYQAGKRMFFFSDSGFEPEAYPVLGSIDPQNAFLLRVHAEKRGKSYTGDSRSYIHIPDIAAYDVYNDSTIEHFFKVLTLDVLPQIRQKAVHLFDDSVS